MRKSSLVLPAIALALFVLLAWQWSSKNYYASQIQALGKYNSQLGMLSGIGPLSSEHLHADVKAYINGKAIDFSQQKYQLATNYMHFEDGNGDVMHTHAKGLTVGHMLNSLGINFNGRCLIIEGSQYCNDKNKRLKFYANGKQSSEFWGYTIKNLDKYLISYGDEPEEAVKKQIDSVTDLAKKYSGENEE